MDRLIIERPYICKCNCWDCVCPESENKNFIKVG